MQSTDDAGNINWSSLIPVTSSFPGTRTRRVAGPLTAAVSAQNCVGLGLLHGRKVKKKSSSAGTSPFCGRMASLPNLFSCSNTGNDSAYNSRPDSDLQAS